MASRDSLRFASIGNIQTQQLLFSYSSDKKTRAYQEEVSSFLSSSTKKSISQYKKKAINLLDEFWTTGIKMGKRFKEDSVFGTWFAVVVENCYCIMCEKNTYISLKSIIIGLTQTVFQDHLAYRILDELKDQTAQVVTSLSNPQLQTFFPDLRKIFQQTFQVYGEGAPANDKLAMAQKKVKQVQHVMQQNVKSMIDGQANLQELEGNTHELLHSASQFNKNSGKLKTLMRRRACKLYLIFGIIVIALLLYILIPIFQ